MSKSHLEHPKTIELGITREKFCFYSNVVGTNMTQNSKHPWHDCMMETQTLSSHILFHSKSFRSKSKVTICGWFKNDPGFPMHSEKKVGIFSGRR